MVVEVGLGLGEEFVPADAVAEGAGDFVVVPCNGGVVRDVIVIAELGKPPEGAVIHASASFGTL